MTKDFSNDEKLKIAIGRCADEPIQFLGKIQNHGFLIILNKKLEITHISENLKDLLKEEEGDILGRNISNFLDPDPLLILIPELSESQDIKHLYFNLYNFCGHDFLVIVHKFKDRIFLELEPPFQHEDPQISFDIFVDTNRRFMIDLSKTQDESDLFKTLVKWVKNIGNFSRVKIYLFDDQWNGTVVAEIRDPHMPSYLNMKFPNTDIPIQARSLYIKNPSRMITNINSKPINIIGKKNDQHNIDLSYLNLRSVSPVHIQYLKNMDINSSYSLSLIKNSQLFGLVACHNNHTHFIEYPRRRLLESIVHNFSNYYNLFKKESFTKIISENKIKLEKIKLAIEKSKNSYQYLKDHFNDLIKILSSDGIIVKIGNNVFGSGTLLNTKNFDKFINWYKTEIQEQYYVTNSF